MVTTRTAPPTFRPPPGAPAANRPKFTLEGLHRGRRKAPDRILLYGVEGVGKSVWAASAPDPIFLASEDGVNHLDVASFSDPRPSTYDEVLAAVDWLADSEHGFRTLVIDTLDWVEHLVRDKIIATNRDIKSGAPWTAQDYDAWGRGVKLAVDEFRKLVAALERLQARKAMEVILVVHARVKTFKNPVGEDYMIYAPKLGGDELPALFVEWCEAVLFANYDITVKATPGSFAKGKARIGDRVLYTQKTSAWEAKNRHGVPPCINLDYEEYVRYRDAGTDSGAAALREEISALRAGLALDAESAAKLDAWVAKAGDHPARLTKVVEFLREKTAAKGGAA